MPTKLPTRRRFWRKPVVSTETRDNFAATSTEFVLALVAVSVTVFILANFDAIGASFDRVQTAGTIFFP